MIRAMLAALGGLLALSLLCGAAGFGVPDLWVLAQIRLPRALLAGLVGGALGLSGAVMQGALRNPLADAGLLGIGGMAALGAVMAYYWGLAALFAPALPIAGMIGAGFGCTALLTLAGRNATGHGLILAGMAVSAVGAALLTFALALAPNPFALAEVMFWLMGGLEDRSLLHLALAAPPILLGVALMLQLGRRLDGLALGEEVALTLGVPVPQTLRLASLGVSLAVGAATSVAGSIGFVGLVVPHLLRPWVGGRPGRLLWPSLLAGALLLMAADLVVRLLPMVLPFSAEPRLGVITALLGAPFLLRMARRVAP